MIRCFYVLIFTVGCSASPPEVSDVTGLQELQKDLDGCREAIKSEVKSVAQQDCHSAVTRFQRETVVDLRASLGAKRTTAIELQVGQLYRTFPTPQIEAVEALQSTIAAVITELSRPVADSK